MLIIFQDLKTGYYECQSSSCACVTSHSHHKFSIFFSLTSLSVWHLSFIHLHHSMCAILPLWDDECVLLTTRYPKFCLSWHAPIITQKHTHSGRLCTLSVLSLSTRGPASTGDIPWGCTACVQYVCAWDDGERWGQWEWENAHTFPQYIIHVYSLKSMS